MRYVATWFDYIAQCEQQVNLEAKNESEAEYMMVLYMDSVHPQNAPHNREDISSLSEVKDRHYLTLDEIESKYEKVRDAIEENGPYSMKYYNKKTESYELYGDGKNTFEYPLTRFLNKLLLDRGDDIFEDGIIIKSK